MLACGFLLFFYKSCSPGSCFQKQKAAPPYQKTGSDILLDCVISLLGCVSKITKAHFRRLHLHIFVEKPRRSTTAPAFFASICKPIRQSCII
jgi:hypothetical protein